MRKKTLFAAFVACTFMLLALPASALEVEVQEYSFTDWLVDLFTDQQPFYISGGTFSESGDVSKGEKVDAKLYIRMTKLSSLNRVEPGAPCGIICLSRDLISQVLVQKILRNVNPNHKISYSNSTSINLSVFPNFAITSKYILLLCGRFNCFSIFQ